LQVASAQVKSALLLAGLTAKGKTVVTEPVRSRDHTETFLRHFEAHIEERGLTVSIEGGQALKAKSFEIAGDISSAAFFVAAALLVPGSKIRFKSVLHNPTRSGILTVLEKAGVSFSESKTHTVGGNTGPEPVFDFSLHAQLPRAFEIKKEQLPSLIDEIPILCVLATQADGESVIRDADELRVKESDRIESIKSMLLPMGANIRSEGSTIYIKGPTKLRGAVVHSKKDHRIAMSGVIAGLIADGETIVEDIDCIDTSFPTYFNLLKRIGATTSTVDTV
jgi:3-phosphoshikimate 1-carboxyvinyltransferase